MNVRFFETRPAWTTAALLLAAGCSSAAEAQTVAPEKVVPVATVVVGERAVPRYLTLTGSLVANRHSEVAADASGKVAQTFVERGSFVDKGAMLAVLDASSAALAAADAAAQSKALGEQAALAAIERDRSERLLAKGAVSSAEVDRMRSQSQASASSAAAAQARAALAGKAVGDSRLRAPFAGLVAERFVSVGEYVRPDTRIVTLLEIDPLRLELTVPEASVGLVADGQPVEFAVSTYPSERFAGSVRYVGASVRRSSRDLVVEAVTANPDKRLRPGMFATARLQVGEQRLPAVPSSAIRRDAGSPRVFVVVGDRLEERLVQLGESDGEFVAVIAGAKVGDAVVSAPGAQVRDGIKVR